MRSCPNVRVQKFRDPDPNTGIVYSDDIDGAYLIPWRGKEFRVIASTGASWEHVSVSLKNRTPTWEEMEHMRELFWRDDETVVQYSVPRDEHINCHPYCLHLWRPLSANLPRPPGILVGLPRSSKVPPQDRDAYWDQKIDERMEGK